MRTIKVGEASKTVLVTLAVALMFWAAPGFAQFGKGGGGGKGFGGFGGFGGKGFGSMSGKGGFGRFGKFNSALYSKVNNMNGGNRMLDLTDLEELTDSTALGKPFGELIGSVIDKEGKPAQGIEILIQRQEVNGDFKVKTDKKGNYSYTGLQGGEYVMAVVYDGDTGLWREVSLRNGHTVRNDFDLKTFEPMGKADMFARLRKGLAEERDVDTGNKALDIPNEYKIEYERALALMAKREYKEAKPILVNLIDKKPDFEAFHYRLGEVHGFLNEYSEAIDQFKLCIEIREKKGEPREAGYPMMISYSLIFMDKLDEAEKMAVTAAEWTPLIGGQAYYNLGIALADKGTDPKKVEDVFRRATELNTRISGAFYQLGVTMLTTHEDDMKLAKPPLQTYLKLEEKEPAGLSPEEKKDRTEKIDAANRIILMIDPPKN